MEVYAWLILRVVYAWMFLYPLKVLLSDWSGTKKTVALLIPFGVPFFAVLMVLVMIAGGLMILLGFYAQIAGFLLLCYSLFGVIVHYRLAAQASALKLVHADAADQAVLQQAINLALVGNITSGQKNVVLAAVGCFFMLMGSGPWSLT